MKETCFPQNIYHLGEAFFFCLLLMLKCDTSKYTNLKLAFILSKLKNVAHEDIILLLRQLVRLNLNIVPRLSLLYRLCIQGTQSRSKLWKNSSSVNYSIPFCDPSLNFVLLLWTLLWGTYMFLYFPRLRVVSQFQY